jgi:hypothetical protein|tara:strand:- start:780 stop:1271 length:492 start_codon:yes stop_codon:yes gene_type:complete
MGKLTWNDLRLIYEGTYGVQADEASKWIAKELFSKNWFGTPKKIGRMWQDIDICIAYSEFLVEVEKFRKKNNLLERAAFIVMHEQKHPAVKAFGMSAKHGMYKMKADRFGNLCGQWNKQLRDVGFLKPKPMTDYTRKSLNAAHKRQEKKIAKGKLLVKRSAKK